MTNLNAPPRLDELPPPTRPPIAAPPPPSPGGPAPSPISAPTSSTAIVVTVVGIAAVALAAAAGGAFWLPRDGDVDRDSAVVRALVSAGIAGLVAGVASLLLHRSGRLRRLGGATTSLLITAGIVLIALGALLGAASAPLAEETEPEPQPQGNPTHVDEDASAALVDADGDGRPDRDADGNVIVAFDPDGDGRYQGRLVPCPDNGAGDSLNAAADVVRLDFDCDGDVDATVPLNAEMIDQWALAPGMTEQDMWVLEPAGDVGGDIDLGGGLDAGDAQPSPTEDADEGGGRGDGIGKVLLTLLAIAALAVLALIAFKVLSGREQARRPEQPDDDEALVETADEDVDAAAVDAAIEESIETLLGHPDPRLAIRAAYAVLLDALAEAGFGRRSFEAPEEHLTRCLNGLAIEAVPMRTLLRLFAIARFSTHVVTEDDRAEALTALRASQRLLREREAAEAAAPST
ncbi:MAG: DUF4129 domain-containing protein [Acidimicrobiales bacterium]